MTTPKPFRAKAHLLKLLGDELIGDDRLAIFELVKNSYDADATIVDVNLDIKNSNIVVHDNGTGMDEDTILNKWMEIGTDSKRKENRARSKKFGRLPLGEKGVGRLAVHKLGTELLVNTKSKSHNEIKIHINWPNLLDEAKYIEDTKIFVEVLEKPEFFLKEKTGTRIEIKNLNNKDWNRGDIRRLKRLLSSLTSPFTSVSDFKVNLKIPSREKDLVDVLESEDVIDRAIWRYDFLIEENASFTYSYSFNPPSMFKGINSTKDEKVDFLEFVKPTEEQHQIRITSNKGKLLLKESDLSGIGPISGTFYIYLRDKEVLNASGAFQDIRTYLDEQTGVRIYRDGIRVFNYGEPNEDWLGLNIGRINRPGQKIGTNMVIAGIDLDLDKSSKLVEKTNREGFDENHTFKMFRWIISSAIGRFYVLHMNDREKITEYIKSGRASSNIDPHTKFSDNVEEIRKSLKKHGLEKEIGGKIDQIETDYKQMREVTLSTGIAGLNLAVIFHEVERGVEELNYAIKNNHGYDKLLERSDHLSKLLEGFAPLLRRNEQKNFKIKSLAQQVLNLSEHRFEHHKIIISCPILSDEDPDFEIRGPFGLLQAALNNLIDNAIHWTKIKYEKEGENFKPAIKVFSLLNWFKEGPAIIVADNGPGFELTPDEAVQPFKTTRPAGMGVGLYYSDKVMETIGGRLIISSAQEFELPDIYDGAAVAMVFKGVKS